MAKHRRTAPACHRRMQGMSQQSVNNSRSHTHRRLRFACSASASSASASYSRNLRPPPPPVGRRAPVVVVGCLVGCLLRAATACGKNSCRAAAFTRAVSIGRCAQRLSPTAPCRSTIDTTLIALYNPAISVSIGRKFRGKQNDQARPILVILRQCWATFGPNLPQVV